jgi:hypothetical protein
MAACPTSLQLQGTFEDPTILFVGEPELVEMKFAEEQPLIVVQFATQQIKCTRDKFGNVVDGDPNSIQVRAWHRVGVVQQHQMHICRHRCRDPSRHMTSGGVAVIVHGVGSSIHCSDASLTVCPVPSCAVLCCVVLCRLQRVYYFWGLMQEPQGVVLPNGKLLPPRWYIRDMMWQVRAAVGVFSYLPRPPPDGVVSIYPVLPLPSDCVFPGVTPEGHDVAGESGCTCLEGVGM